jgi:N-acetylglutamate synthase-like GNAT family acetyltransferase
MCAEDIMKYKTRVAQASDAEDISKVILWALRETNVKDYSPEIIEQVALSFNPSAVLELISKRNVFVALVGKRVIGTASLDGSVVRTVFVAPDVQGHGIGRLLMAEVERTAREMNVEVLVVPSSVTAERFYSKLGFKAVRDSYHGNERTIIMERPL